MNYERAQRLIILATIVTLGSTVSNVLRKPKNQKQELKAHRVIAGGFFAMMGCGIITEFDPNLGVGLASLVAIYTFGEYGVPVLIEAFKQQAGEKQGASTPNPRIQRVTV